MLRDIHLGAGVRIGIYPFEQYEMPKTDARGIHRIPEVHPVAWFRDPAGNILSVVQEPST